MIWIDSIQHHRDLERFRVEHVLGPDPRIPAREKKTRQNIKRQIRQKKKPGCEAGSLRAFSSEAGTGLREEKRVNSKS
jgi:hypothetical protein